jgi:HPt (histidine-containing phosphotransfer) domain-containing protein
LGDNNAEVVRRQGHRIKWASANINAQTMRDLVYEIELAGKAGEIDRALPLVEKLEQEFQKLQSAVSIA